MKEVLEYNDITTRQQKFDGVSETRLIHRKIPGIGHTIREIKTTFGSSGAHFKYDVTIPTGTRCKEIIGEPANLFVDDLSWIPKIPFDGGLIPDYFCIHDATYTGIRVKREDVTMEDA